MRLPKSKFGSVIILNNNNIKVGVSNKEGQLGFVFSRGGLREGSGRKSIGVTKKISLTLTEDMWGEIENHCTEHKLSRSEAIRNIIESFYS
ncbi:hypothetical protein CQ043_09160 [Paenibacillus sp. MYb63]|nr:hypothetical protein CQ043_09160 [Paenibacillus sp. MYb63]PRA51191.1 hypothetical protein CQ061_02315 [Paenibacillus sp. MYb67]QZN74316.1 ribbon-helix-helix domain-containing protein [Paenibacillus sp. DR312]